MALFGSFPTVRAQLRLHPLFEVAFAYVAEALRPDSEAFRRIHAVEVGKTGRVELGQGVFALEQAYLTKARETGNWESHMAFIDVQVVVAGEEFMEVADVGLFTLAQDFRPAKDLIFYKPFDGGSVLRARAGDAAVFFPIDSHLPSLSIQTPGLVRKTVVKVPVV